MEKTYIITKLVYGSAMVSKYRILGTFSEIFDEFKYNGEDEFFNGCLKENLPNDTFDNVCDIKHFIDTLNKNAKDGIVFEYSIF